MPNLASFRTGVLPLRSPNFVFLKLVATEILYYSYIPCVLANARIFLFQNLARQIVPNFQCLFEYFNRIVQDSSVFLVFEVAACLTCQLHLSVS